MEDANTDLIVIGIIIAVGVLLAIRAWFKHPKCPQCAIRMSYCDKDDPLEPKIGGGLRLDLTCGLPHKVTRHYRCPECGRKLSRAERSWDST